MLQIFCKIITLDLSYIVPVKSTMEILQNVVAFPECMNFNYRNKQYNIYNIPKLPLKFNEHI